MSVKRPHGRQKCEKCGRVHEDRNGARGNPRRCQGHRNKTRPYVQCNANAMVGKDMCDKHGGKSQEGPASANWKDGRFSEFLGGGLRRGYDETVVEPDLRTLREEIALTAGLQRETIERLGTGESRETWREVQRLVATLTATLKGDDRELNARLWRELTDAVGAGHRAERGRRDLERLNDQQRRLRGEESKMIERDLRAMSRDEVLALARAFGELAVRFIDDKKQRGIFARELRLLAEPQEPVH